MVRTGHLPSGQQRVGYSAMIIGVASLLVAAVGTGVVLSRGAGPVSQASTTLTNVHNALVVAPDGHSVAARDGQRVANGEVVRTGRGGSAELVTRGRLVYLDSAAAVEVVDGAHQQLRTGQAVVDALHGPGLRLDLAGDVVSVRSGSATEATRSVSVEVGSLSGPTEITSANARRLTIPSLFQAVESGDALPATFTPLHLSDDAAEAAAVPALVSDDETLNDLARGINSSGTASASFVTASWTGHTSAMPKATPRSERVLPMVIADATSSAGESKQVRYNHAVGWRQAGGSWGVVVALLNGRASAVEAVFDRLEHSQPTGQVGTVSFRALAAPTVPLTRHSKPSDGSSPRPGGTTTGSSSPKPGAGSGSKHHSGGSAPNPTSSPVHKVITTVQGVVGGVLGVLPVKILPKPKPKPTPTGLLGGLLGGH